MPDSFAKIGKLMNFTQISQSSAKAYSGEYNCNIIIHELKGEWSKISKVRDTVCLKHMYLQQIFNIISENGVPYAVLCDEKGTPLSDVINQGGNISQNRIIKWIYQLCSAIDFLNKQGIIHTCISPKNIIVRPDDNICLCGLDISCYAYNYKFYCPDTPENYAPPEYYSMLRLYCNNTASSNDFSGLSSTATVENTFIDNPNEKSIITQAYDMYSLGAVIYYMLTGITPKSSVSENNPPINMLRSDVIDGLAEISQKCMNSLPKARPAKISAVTEILADLPQFDKRYKDYNKKYIFQILMLSAGLIFSCIGIIQGKNMIDTEKNNQYNELVSGMYSDINDFKFSDVEIKYSSALNISNSDGEAYYCYAKSLFMQENYDECIEYCKENLSNIDDKDNYYYCAFSLLTGNCYRENGNFSTAEKYFKECYEKSSDENLISSAYNAHICMLAENGDIIGAEKLYSVNCSKITLTERIFTEAFLNLKDCYYEAAIESFQEYIACSYDEYMKSKAYVLCSEAIILCNTNDYKYAIDFLNDGLEAAPEISKKIISIQTARLCSEYGLQKSDNSYIQKAILLYRQLLNDDNNSDNDEIYCLLYMLYRNIGSNETANILNEMKVGFSDSYRYYVCCAINEYDLQEELSENDRDYSFFRQYYKLAGSYYDGSECSAKDYLEDIYFKQFESSGTSPDNSKE